jgi:hypothetical protein
VGLLLAVLALAARFVDLGGHPLWLDEVHTYDDSTELLPRLLSWDLTGTTHSPLPYVEVKVLRSVLGSSETVIRLPAAMYGSMAVVLFYLAVGRSLRWRVAAMAGALLAVHPYALEWAREARMYSHWLFHAVLLTLVAHTAMTRARGSATGGAGRWLDWPWWLLGMLAGVAHASAVQSISTILALFAGLTVLGLVELFQDRRAAGRMLSGVVASAMVYFTSWSVAGFAMLMTKRGSGQKQRPDLAAMAVDTLTEVGGFVTREWLLVLLAMAGVGLLLLAWRGPWRSCWLWLLVGLSPWAMMPSIAARHFFAGRYVMPSILLLCLGLGSLLAWLWLEGTGPRRRVGQALGLAAVLALAVAWAPAWRGVYLHPKFDFPAAIAPVQQHAADGDLLLLLPDHLRLFEKFYPFKQGTQATVKVLLPPPAVRTVPYGPDDADLQAKGFDAAFERIYTPQALATRTLPPRLWVLVNGPGSAAGAVRLESLRPLLHAYGVSDDQITALRGQAAAARTLTFRVSSAGLDHVTLTTGRTLGH